MPFKKSSCGKEIRNNFQGTVQVKHSQEIVRTLLFYIHNYNYQCHLYFQLSVSQSARMRIKIRSVRSDIRFTYTLFTRENYSSLYSYILCLGLESHRKDNDDHNLKC